MVISHRWRQAESRTLCALALLCSGCSASSLSAGAQESTSTSVRASSHSELSSSRYLDIAKRGNERLERDIDAPSGRDKDRLRSALADLHDASVTERLFDRRLLVIPFPPTIKTIAFHLYSTNQARATVTAGAAKSRTFRELHSFETRISAENKVVESQVRRIRTALDLPPPDSS